MIETLTHARRTANSRYDGDDLRKIYDKIRSNEMDFEEFKKVVKLR